MNKEEAYLTQAEEAIEKKQPFSAVVYAFLGLIEIFGDIRDLGYSYRPLVENIDRSLEDIKASARNIK